MIVPKLKGGLGNQMFTIAAAYGKSLDLNTTIAINYGLQHYGGANQGQPPTDYKDTLFKNIPVTEEMPAALFLERDWVYAPIPDNDNMIIEGYFQCEKHFEKHADKVKALWHIPDNVKEKIDKVITKIPKKILGIHVRLGDFLHYRDAHLICTREYYLNALKQFNLDDYTVIVCTDDPENYQKYISIDNAILCNSSSELEDLYLLSQSDSLIMSNSTFSWWASYLGKAKEKVCAPSKWFGPAGPRNYKDIYRDSWTVISV